MKTLIYTVAFGDDINFKLAENLFSSLRAQGYEGDVAAVCDRKHDFSDKNARVFIPNSPERPVLHKMAIPAAVAKTYDLILFLDADTGALQPVDSVFALGDDKILLSRLFEFRLRNDRYNLKVLSEQEQKLVSDGGLIEFESRSVNTGTMLIPGPQYAAFAAMVTDAWQGVQKPKYHPGDQPVIQALMVRGLFKYDYFPDGMVIFPQAERFRYPTTSTVFAHFAGYPSGIEGKEKCLAAIQDYPNELKRVAERFARDKSRLEVRKARAKGAEAGSAPEVEA